MGCSYVQFMFTLSTLPRSDQIKLIQAIQYFVTSARFFLPERLRVSAVQCEFSIVLWTWQNGYQDNTKTRTAIKNIPKVNLTMLVQ